MDQIILANFGGPRSLEEVTSFLTELLTDQDVVRTDLRPFVHRFLFSRIAKKRAKKVVSEYESIGGKSPIYEDTEKLSVELKRHLGVEVVPFHRYISATHDDFVRRIEAAPSTKWHVFPLFPQFSYATTGSCARFFSKILPPRVVTNMRWLRSYPINTHFIDQHVAKIKRFIVENKIQEEELALLFSAHGVPQKFVESGDLYLEECQASFEAVMSHFPSILGKLSFQSIFGKEEWLKPYTEAVCKDPGDWIGNRTKVLVVPISFTSDHIETLHEIENQYLPLLREAKLEAFRLSSFGVEQMWVEAIGKILKTGEFVNNSMLIRPNGCLTRCPSCKKRCRR